MRREECKKEGRKRGNRARNKRDSLGKKNRIAPLRTIVFTSRTNAVTIIMYASFLAKFSSCWVMLAPTDPSKSSLDRMVPP
jgi:hypothetical protein